MQLRKCLSSSVGTEALVWKGVPGLGTKMASAGGHVIQSFRRRPWERPLLRHSDRSFHGGQWVELMISITEAGSQGLVAGNIHVVP